MFFIPGITGRVGGFAAQRLIDDGRSVRALVRDPEKAADWAEKGVELKKGDLTDADALADALRGVEAAFVMQPTPVGVTRDFPEGRALTRGIGEAVRRVTPRRLVVLSSVGSEQRSGLGNITQTHFLEEALASLDCPTAIVRAGAFIENNLGSLDRANSTGWFDSFLQPIDRGFPMVASRDIGLEVAKLLRDEWQGRRIIELGSPITPDEIAAAMAETLGTPVKARPIPRDAWAGTLTAMGLAGDKIGNWEEMQDGFNSGWIAFGRPGTEKVAGTTKPAQVFAQAPKA